MKRAKWVGRYRLFAAACAAVVLAAGCSEDKIEKMIGGQVARAVESTYKPVADPALQDWARNMGYSIVGVSTRQHIPYTFMVLDSDSVNAFAAPWGHVYFMRGLLDFAENEDEVWAVAGHEIGHVVHRDIIKAVKRSFLWSVGATIIARKSRTVGDVLGIGLGLLSFHYSRQDEREADDAGVEYVYRAGHDPRAMITFFSRLMKKYEKDKPSKLEALLRTHPLTSARIDRQKKRPELDPNNAQALARIGRGYMQRGQYMQAMRLLTQALASDSELPGARIALAEAAVRRGYLALAARELEAARKRLGHVPAIERWRQAVANARPQSWPQWSEAERQRATRLAEAMRPALGAIDRKKQNARQATAALSQSIQPLSESSRRVGQRLRRLAANQTEVTDPVQNMLVQSNAIVVRAMEGVSKLEGLADRLNAVGAETEAAAQDLRRLADRGLDGGPPRAADWLQRALYEIEAAQDDAAAAAAVGSAATGTVKTAVSSAEDASVYMDRLVSFGEDELVIDSLRAAARRTESYATQAKEKVEKALKPALRAQVRIAVAKMNMAGIGATPEELQAMAEVVAYFARVPVERVKQLVAEGAGLGDAAVALIASKSAHKPATELVKEGLAASSFVDAVQSAGGSFAAASILLKYAARALEDEAPTGEHEPPRFTS